MQYGQYLILSGQADLNNPNDQAYLQMLGSNMERSKKSKALPKNKPKEYHYMSINDEYRLQIDKSNISLQKLEKDDWIDLNKNYATIPNALNGYCLDAMKKALNLDHLFRIIEKLNKTFSKMEIIFPNFKQYL